MVEVGRVLVGSAVDEGALHLGDPPINDVVEGPTRTRRGAQFLDHLAVHVIELVEVQIVVRDDHEARRKALRLCIEECKTRHERLAAAVAPTEELEDALSGTRELKQPVDLGPLPLDADRERIEATLRDRTGSEPLEDVKSVALAGAHRLPVSLTHVALATFGRLDTHSEWHLGDEAVPLGREAPESPR